MLGYEYFCGANVVIEIEGFPILEAVGIRVNGQESKTPIYGYSSRHFDAVARGRVLVEGSLVVNYVHQDYLFRAIELGLLGSGSKEVPEASKDFEDIVFKPGNTIRTELYDALKRRDKDGGDNYEDHLWLAQAFKDKFWQSENPAITGLTEAANPYDVYGGLDIVITFGERHVGRVPAANIGYKLQGVYFTSRGHIIEIDEKVIVEEYNFFARDIQGLRKKYAMAESPPIAAEPSNPKESTVENIGQVPTKEFDEWSINIVNVEQGQFTTPPKSPSYQTTLERTLNIPRNPWSRSWLDQPRNLINTPSDSPMGLVPLIKPPTKQTR